jgi:hypothetical protein
MRPRLTYANVMATIAVFIAFGGVSYAAIKLPKNSVGTKQLKKNAVTGTKVKDGSLTGKDIDNESLGKVPFANKAASADQSNTANTAQSAGSAGYAARAASAGNGAVPIDWSSPGVQFRPSETILSLDELTLSAWCEDTNGLHEADYVQVFFTATKPGSVGWAFSASEDSSPVVEQGYLNFKAGSDNRIINQRSYFGIGLQDGQAIFRFDDRVITVLLHARADHSANACQVNGIAFSAPG